MIESIVEGIKDILINALWGILDLVFWLIGLLISVILTPIDYLFRNAFPSFSTFLTNFSNSLVHLSSAPFSWFINMLPPITKTIVFAWLYILIAYYSIIWTYRAIIFIPKVYNKIKFW